MASLADLAPAVVRALERAGLAGSGALDAFADLPDEELRLVYADLIHGISGVDTDAHYEAFLGALRGAGTAAKRHRRALAHAPPSFAALWRPRCEDAPSPASAPLPPLPPAPLGQGPRWPTRLRRDLAAAQGPAAVRTAEDKDRDRWAKQAVEVIRAARLPSAVLSERSLDPGAFLARCLGGRRARTLRTRVRSWLQYSRWAAAGGIVVFPAGDDGIVAVIAYLEERAGEPCATTVPQEFLYALGFFEESGGVPEATRVSKSPVVARAVQDIGVSIDTRGAAGARKYKTKHTRRAMPSRYNLLASQVRRLRCVVEGWHHHESSAPPGDEADYENTYKQAQLAAHQYHWSHNVFSGHLERSSGLALRRAKPLLSTHAYRRRRQITRVANAMRHPDGLRAEVLQFVPHVDGKFAEGAQTDDDGDALQLEAAPDTSTDVSFPSVPGLIAVDFAGADGAAVLRIQSAVRGWLAKRAARALRLPEPTLARSSTAGIPCRYGQDCPWHRLS